MQVRCLLSHTKKKLYIRGIAYLKEKLKAIRNPSVNDSMKLEKQS